MGNEPSALKDDGVVSRGGDVDRGYKHAERQKQALQDLDKLRRQQQLEAKSREDKQKRHSEEATWEEIKEGLEEGFVERVLKPIEAITGLDKCVQKHTEEDDDEYEVVYVRAGPKKSVRDKVKEMMREVEDKHVMVDFYEEAPPPRRRGN